ncbi:sensor histidine kinase [Indioceanicola profundi]|uniref:sensor histidine kinase n=1 Tax=Indioceanicola profundi TaxID=2220096 RepID=UPI000E6AD3E6|nr:ATP-binding protein [Indioceanicola profundi]
MDAGQLAVQDERVDLGRLCGEVIRLMQRQSEMAGLTMALTLTPPSPAIRADHRRLRQILLNLAGNAVKFTPAGECISILAEVSPGAVAVRVTDTGTGIAPDRIPDLGRPFVQINDNVLTRPHQGSGMGLSISRVLAELHGGMVLIQSQPEAGTEVTLSLPLLEQITLS